MLVRLSGVRPRLTGAGNTVLAERRRVMRPALDPEGRGGVRCTSDSAGGVLWPWLGDPTAGLLALRCGLRVRELPPGNPCAAPQRLPR